MSAVDIPKKRPSGCVLWLAAILLVAGGCGVWAAVSSDGGGIWAGVCKPAVDGRLPAGGVPDYEVSSVEFAEFEDGTRQATGNVEVNGQEYFFECQTDEDLNVTDVVVVPR